MSLCNKVDRQRTEIGAFLENFGLDFEDTEMKVLPIGMNRNRPI